MLLLVNLVGVERVAHTVFVSQSHRRLKVTHNRNVT
jgi:hypothetical protein